MRRPAVEKMSFYKPSVEAALNLAREAMVNFFSHNDIDRAAFIRNHKGYGYYNHATAAKHFEWDAFFGLMYVLGYRLKVRETDTGWVLMLDPSQAYDSRVSIPSAISANQKVLRHSGIFPLPHTELSFVGQIYWSRQAYDIVRGPDVPDHQIILEFIRK